MPTIRVREGMQRKKQHYCKTSAFCFSLFFLLFCVCVSTISKLHLLIISTIIMASSNRHWPSMFKSKPCSNHHHHQWQHDSASPNCHPKPTPYSSGLEERSPEPKPRWNPRPEQIRILEAIFNSGMVNPPREEIRKIRARLQEYGQVGDANVFYWFQNRKSRSKSKLRGSAAGRSNPHPPLPPATNASSVTTVAAITTSSSSSSSSPEKSSAGSGKALQVMHSAPPPLPPPPPPTTATSLMNSQTYLPLDLSGIGDHFLNLQHFTGFHTDISSTSLWGELLGQTPNKSTAVQLHHLYGTGPSTTATPTTTTTNTNPITEIQGLIGGGRSTVFINELAFEVVPGSRLNVKEAFGGEALLLDHSGRPVVTNELGVTLHPLQHGASYYLA